MDEIHVHKTKKSICAHFAESPCIYIYVCVCVCMLEFRACMLYLLYILSLVNISLLLWQHIGHLL